MKKLISPKIIGTVLVIAFGIIVANLIGPYVTGLVNKAKGTAAS